MATDKSEKVFAGSQYIATSLAKSLFDFRDKKIVSLTQSEVETISYQTGKEKPIEFARKDGKWQITAPEDVEADTTTVNNFLDDVIGLRATEFFDAPTKDQLAAVTSPNLHATITLAGAKVGSRIVKIGKTKEGNILVGLDPIKQMAKVGDDAKSKFSKTLNDFRNKKIFDFQSAQVEVAQLDDKNFVRVKDEWYSKDDSSKFDKEGKFSGKEADKPKPAQHVRTLLVDLEYAKAEAVMAGDSEVAKKLPEAPKNRIKLDFAAASSKPSLTIDIWQAGDSPEEIYIKPSGSTKLFKAKKSVIASMTPAPALPAQDAAFPPQDMPKAENNL